MTAFDISGRVYVCVRVSVNPLCLHSSFRLESVFPTLVFFCFERRVRNDMIQALLRGVTFLTRCEMLSRNDVLAL